MSNVLSVYDPLFYAQEAIMLLYKVLGMAARVHRGYDKSPQDKGSIISIRKPGTFTAQDAPASSDQDIKASEVQIALNKWKEVTMGLTDKELTFTKDDIIREHIEPAAFAIATAIDDTLLDLYADIPWGYTNSGATAVDDILQPRKILFDNAAPQGDGKMHLMVDGSKEAGFLGLSAFSQWQGAGPTGVDTQLKGTLGYKFGVEVFASQKVRSHVAGTINDLALQVLGATLKGATTISLDAVDGGVTGTLKPGDTFVIAGNTQRYAVTALSTAAANAFTGVLITPPLAQDHADNDAVTVFATSHVANLMFHRNAFALAMAPLSDIGKQVSAARIETIIDKHSGLSLRVTMWYDENNSKVKIRIDALWGVKTLDPNLGCRLRV